LCAANLEKQKAGKAGAKESSTARAKESFPSRAELADAATARDAQRKQVARFLLPASCFLLPAGSLFYLTRGALVEHVPAVDAGARESCGQGRRWEACSQAVDVYARRRGMYMLTGGGCICSQAGCVEVERGMGRVWQEAKAAATAAKKQKEQKAAEAAEVEKQRQERIKWAREEAKAKAAAKQQQQQQQQQAKKQMEAAAAAAADRQRQQQHQQQQQQQQAKAANGKGQAHLPAANKPANAGMVRPTFAGLGPDALLSLMHGGREVRRGEPFGAGSVQGLGDFFIDKRAGYSTAAAAASAPAAAAGVAAAWVQRYDRGGGAARAGDQPAAARRNGLLGRLRK
jgi:chemotaxis protein histidine kinase CheA